MNVKQNGLVVLIDNYDSFSYNLYQLIGAINPNIRVIRNDEMTVSEVKELDPAFIVISPGPGRPADAGISVEAARVLGESVPILGVCLGHQAIYEAFGGTVSYSKELMHGKSSDVKIDTSCPLFSGLSGTIKAARYHSLAGVRDTLPDTLKVVGETLAGEVMAVVHKERKIYGLQFHPESILTPDGRKIIENFLKLRIFTQKRESGSRDISLFDQDEMLD
ncbi:aminodeoxychorismate/anthranilate synthase component II [Clostridia bacterium]|nr:aminodeoxychorismate/anthranilate synthase component II [Clostridia bacterium]